MKTVKSVQEAIDAVVQGSVAVYSDIYADQIKPDYHILETREEAKRFQELVQAVEQEEGYEALEELEAFVGQPCLPSQLSIVYKDGKWVRNPEDLLQEESWNQQMEEDWEWLEAQREYFESLQPVFLSVFDPLLGERVSVQKQLLTDPAYYNDTTRRLRKLAISQGLLEDS